MESSPRKANVEKEREGEITRKIGAGHGRHGFEGEIISVCASVHDRESHGFNSTEMEKDR